MVVESKNNTCFFILNMASSTSKKKRKLDEWDSIELSLEQIVRLFNACNGKNEYSTCYECGKLEKEDDLYEASGYKKNKEILCRACVMHCTACDEYYAPSGSYYHDDCGVGCSD